MDDDRTIGMDSKGRPLSRPTPDSGDSWERTQFGAGAGSAQPAHPGGPGQPGWPPGPPPPPAGRESSETVLMGAGGTQTEPSFAWLVVTSGPAVERLRGQPLTLRLNAPTTIGRAPDGDIVLPDPAASSRHAVVKAEPGAGGVAFVITDLASANGLYVGDREHYKEDASRSYRRALHDGDYLLIGETTLVFKQI